MLPSAFQTAEPIAGYTIQERIGAGGYGEVWRAVAPGGLAKAIKFVYGYLDDERAARELKALNRIKEVRHPFLLSLERIEVIDRQLVIVTELAEMSLKDCFDQCKESGEPGISRDQLLIYLGDAADALDYMRENYSLQHLDVKPENLLIVGGRVKVADFGLVKDIHDATASMMGGLTPSYAPPESFDDRPSLQSDQYSLAIVFQEMLTGVLPFPGTTATQLAVQHLNSPPRLGPLPASDRAAVARALAKNPKERFESCRALIDALLKPESAAKDGGHGADGRLTDPAQLVDTPPAVTPATEPADQAETEAEAPKADPAPRSPDTHTLVFAPGGPSGDTPIPASRVITAAPPTPKKATILPPIVVDAEESRLRPTLFVGIGGTAGRTLRALHHLLLGRFGSLDAVPAFEMLLLDTDRHAVAAATQGVGADVLQNRRTLLLPLRRPQDYRDESTGLLKWLSRRWLFNIPRSLQTEGRRPLGRLAFADHAKEIFQRLRENITAITSKEAIAATKEKTGLGFRSETPRIFIVSSISGGTGSGMVIDLAYAVRMVLEHLHLSDQGICNILTHSTSNNPNGRDLAIANSCACLGELEHFAGTGRFPGDPACGLPAFDDAGSTFRDTYLVHLGDDLDEEQFNRATKPVAEYLYLNTVTAAGPFFDKCRQTRNRLPEPSGSSVQLKTFGLFQFGFTQGPTVTAAAEALSKDVVLRWSGQCDDQNQRNTADPPKLADLVEPAEPTDSDAPVTPFTEDQIDELSAQRAEQLRLTADELTTQIGGILEGELGVDADTYFRSLVQQLLGARKVPGAGTLIDAVDEVLGVWRGPRPAEASAATHLQTTLDRHLRQLAPSRADALGQWVLDLVDHPRARVRKAERAAKWFAEYISSLEEGMEKSLELLTERIVEAEQTLLAPDPSNRGRFKLLFGFGRGAKRTEDRQQPWIEYCQLRVQATVVQGIGRLLQLLLPEIIATSNRLRSLQQRIGILASQFDTGSSWNDPGGNPDGVPNAHDELRATVVEALGRAMPGLPLVLDTKFHTELLATKGGLRAILERTVDLDCPLEVALREAARRVILDTLKHIDVAAPLLPTRDGSRDTQQLEASLEAAAPRLHDCGGSKRLLLVLPEASDPAPVRQVLENDFQETASVVFDSDGDMVLCCEVEQLPLVAAAVRITDNRADYIQAAARLHTRVDVKWTPLGYSC